MSDVEYLHQCAQRRYYRVTQPRGVVYTLRALRTEFGWKSPFSYRFFYREQVRFSLNIVWNSIFKFVFPHNAIAAASTIRLAYAQTIAFSNVNPPACTTIIQLLY